MRILAVVGGIPGVGKTTVLGIFDSIVRSRGRSALVVNYGTVMFEEAASRGVKHRDEMRNLPADVQREIQVSAARKISSSGGDIVIVDTHFSIKTPYGYLPGVPSHIASALSPDYLVVISASPDEVLARRTSDSTRVRESSIDSIREELEMEVLYAVSASNATGAPLSVIQNRQGSAESTARELAARLGV